MATIQPVAIPDGPRRRTQASTMLLHEYAQKLWPDYPQFYEYRLGPTPLSVPGYPLTPAIQRMLRLANMYSDLIVVEPDTLRIVEAKVVGTPSAVSQLRAYASLVLNTPELAQYAGRRMVETHLWAVDHELAHQMATAAGQAVIIYTPTWIEDYLSQKYYRVSPSAPGTSSETPQE